MWKTHNRKWFRGVLSWFRWFFANFTREAIELSAFFTLIHKIALRTRKSVSAESEITVRFSSFSVKFLVLPASFTGDDIVVVDDVDVVDWFAICCSTIVLSGLIGGRRFAVELPWINCGEWPIFRLRRRRLRLRRLLRSLRYDTRSLHSIWSFVFLSSFFVT